MPVATSMAALEQMLIQEMRAAMNEANTKTKQTLDKELKSFYSSAGTGRYVRTGQLGNSGKADPVSGGGKQLSFDVYIDKGSISYGVPNPRFTDPIIAQQFDGRTYASYFSTDQVLNAAEAGAAHIAGNPGFWARAEGQFQSDLDAAMSSHFN